MNMQALLIRATVMIVPCMGLSVALLNSHPAAPVESRASTSTTQTTSIEPQPILLPTVSVRPTAAEMAAAMNDANSSVATSPHLIDASETSTIYDNVVPALPSLRLDMPYYSFGKVLPRVRKE